jgi:hypothetical protein
MYIGLDVKYRLFLSGLMKLEFSGQIFEKSSNIQFHENPPSGSRVVACEWTDRHEEANSRSSQFCELAQKIFFCPDVKKKTSFH